MPTLHYTIYSILQNKCQYYLITREFDAVRNPACGAYTLLSLQLHLWPCFQLLICFLKIGRVVGSFISSVNSSYILFQRKATVRFRRKQCIPLEAACHYHALGCNQLFVCLFSICFEWACQDF